MLFAYKYVPHKIEKMQAFIDFIFFEVWCKAPIGLEFSADLFDALPDLKEIISHFGFAAQAPERGRKFYKDIKDIYQLFAALSSQQIDQFKQWYQANNDIEKVCNNDPSCHVVRYSNIETIYPELSAQLESFFKGLYSQLGLATIQEAIGKIDDYYQEFMKINNTGKCPFCGISDMLGPYHTRREAYDHFLPKALYPFNSVNFHNLAPACHHCNSSYKTTKEPTFVPKDPAGERKRRKAFYPYAAAGHAIEIIIDLSTPDTDRLTSANIQITFGPDSIKEEIETWRDIYGIDERYKAKCCDSDAKDWLEQIRILNELHGVDPTAYLAALQQQADKAPVANSNFLKKAFLEGCQRAGLFDAIAKIGTLP